MPLKHSCICVKHFTDDSFEQNLVVRSLLGPSFKLHQLVVKKDERTTNFSVECFTAQKEKFPHKFPFTCFFLAFRCCKMAEEILVHLTFN